MAYGSYTQTLPAMKGSRHLYIPVAATLLIGALHIERSKRSAEPVLPKTVAPRDTTEALSWDFAPPDKYALERITDVRYWDNSLPAWPSGSPFRRLRLDLVYQHEYTYTYRPWMRQGNGNCSDL